MYVKNKETKMGYVIAHGTDLVLSQQAANIEYEMMIISDNIQMLSQDAANIMSQYSTSTNGGTGGVQQDAYAKLAEINAKEKALEAELKVLQTQHSAIQQNMEATEKLIDENVKKSAAWS